MDFIEIKKVSKSFGGLQAVDDLTFDLGKGKIKGIIGPNGAGKTTVFNLISGILSMDSGEIFFKGTLLNRLRPYQIAYLGISRTFQNLQLFDNMTVIENVMVGLHTRTRSEIFHALLRLSHSREEEQHMFERAYETLKMVNMESKASEIVSGLSFGEQKLVEVARALVSDPEIIMLDEPVSGLNAQEIERLDDLIRKINAQGKTILLVEHNMRFVMDICEEVLVLNYGKKIAEGDPSQIVSNREVINAYLGEELKIASN
jgi:branched-chain amino acid transport system ATP-binding protein